MDIEIPGYTLKKPIGKGGMAHVYLALQHNMDRPVAIKILSPSGEAEQVYAERFLQEARTVATLNHPHIIPVYDVGQQGRDYYIVMEYLPGFTLAHWINVGIEAEEALNVIEQVAQALHYSHSKGVVHRDIKPENIMFREDHSAVLMDFGIAQSDKVKKHLTMDGQMIGTPAYMSPEQARGQKVDARSDLYSLGVVFYEMLTKQQPYTGEDAISVALKQVTEAVPQLPPQFSLLQGLLQGLMAKEPDQRFQNGLTLVKAIRPLREPSQQLLGSASHIGQKVTSQKISRHINAGDTVIVDEAVVHTAVAAESKAMAAERVNKQSGTATALNSNKPAVGDDGAHVEARREEDVITVKAADLTLVSDSESNKGSLPQKNFSVDIAVKRRALLFKRSVITVTVVSMDISQLNVQMSQVGQRLLDWRDEYEGGAKEVNLTFYCKPWLQESVEKFIQQMMASKVPYGFLNKLKLNVVFFDLSGHSLLER